MQRQEYRRIYLTIVPSTILLRSPVGGYQSDIDQHLRRNWDVRGNLAFCLKRAANLYRQYIVGLRRIWTSGFATSFKAAIQPDS